MKICYLLAVTLSACSAGQLSTEDAMGNLPDSRTITLTPDDPFPSNLGNEIQDCIVGGKRGTFTRKFFPKFIHQTTANFWGGADNPLGAGHPRCLKTASATLVSAYFEIPFEDGDVLTGFSTEIYGDTTIDPALQVLYSTGMGAAVSSPGLSSLVNVPAAWTAFPVTIVPQPLVVGSTLTGVITTTSISTANVFIGQMAATFRRP